MLSNQIFKNGMILSALSFLIPVLSSGCSMTRHIDARVTPGVHEEIGMMSMSQDVLIILLDGREIETGRVWVGADSTRWEPRESETIRGKPPQLEYPGPVATSEVEKIVLINRSKGALQGAGKGFLGGAALGATVGYLAGDESDMTGKSGAAVAGAVGLGVLGSIVGAAFGSDHGVQHIYIINGDFEDPGAHEPADRTFQ